MLLITANQLHYWPLLTWMPLPQGKLKSSRIYKDNWIWFWCHFCSCFSLVATFHMCPLTLQFKNALEAKKKDPHCTLCSACPQWKQPRCVIAVVKTRTQEHSHDVTHRLLTWHITAGFLTFFFLREWKKLHIWPLINHRGWLRHSLCGYETETHQTHTSSSFTGKQTKRAEFFFRLYFFC